VTPFRTNAPGVGLKHQRAEGPGAWAETLILDGVGAARVLDVDSALLSVQERDNWRRRMEVLERSLREVREHRRRIESRLRRVRRDLARLRQTSDALLDVARTASARSEIARASPSYVYHGQ
jgi:hypothetical protein